MSEKLREELKQLCTQVETNYLALAGKLKPVYRDKTYTEWGFDDFSTYLETDIHVSKRKALYLISIHDVFIDKYVVDEKTLTEIGWSRAKELLPLYKEGLLTESNLEEWLHKARNLPQRALNEEVKLVLGKTADDEQTKITIALFPKQKEIVEEALRLALMIANTEHRGTALELICGDFIATAQSVEEGLMPEEWKESRLRWIEQVVEEVYGKGVTYHELQVIGKEGL